MRVTYDWEDASVGFLVLDIAGALHPRNGGGRLTSPAHVQHRFSAERPAASDRGEPFEVVGLKSRRVVLEPGQKLWLRAHVSQTMLNIERS